MSVIHRALPVAAAAALALVLTGCVANNATGTTAVTVTISDDGCAVSPATAPAGPVTFTITNTGSNVKEFEVLASDKLRIAGEKENVTPGQTVALVTQLEAGTYFTACKFQQVGEPTGLATFTATGHDVENADAKKQSDAAVTNYVSYLKSQTEALLPAAKTLVAAYVAGHDDAARSLFASTRAYYEPTAEAFGDLDPKIDYREVDAVAEGLSWTGFHRIEKDLWPPAAGSLNSDGTSALTNWSPSTPAERSTFGTGLITDITKLDALVHSTDFTITLADISNGAIGLLDEVAKNKITGEEDWWSHTDLTDFAANVQGAEVAFGNVEQIAKAKNAEGAALVASIQKEFDALDALLTRYGSIPKGYLSYATVTDAQRKELSDQVNALAEPLSQLTHAVLGVDAG